MRRFCTFFQAFEINLLTYDLCVIFSMLSTRRRRILHIAADSWEAGGGHFERRISFGYDADLARVRAEFDGEHLRVLVPRKIIPVTWIGAQDLG